MANAELGTRPVERLGPSRFVNRELARLSFDERVLAMAEDVRLPLLERVRFLSIFSRNLDDFFQIRVAGLQEQLLASVQISSPDGMSPADQLRAIHDRVRQLLDRQLNLFNKDLLPHLEESRIRIRDAASLGKSDRQRLAAQFKQDIFPVLTPLAVDPAHPFPYISHLSLNLAVIVRDPLRRQQRFARVKVPPLLAPFIRLPDDEGLLPIEQVISINLQSLFPGMEIVEQTVFRLTRDADLDVFESEAEDLLSAVEAELRRQRRHGRAVRLEVEPSVPEEVRRLLIRELELGPEDVYPVPWLLDLGRLDFFCEFDRPDLKSRPWVPATQIGLAPSHSGADEIFGLLSRGDILVHHLYDSFATSVEAFIEQAARDPQVLAIKQTLYRTSGTASAIATALMRAAGAGKQVVALVELKARGDEQANIGRRSAWALRGGGCRRRPEANPRTSVNRRLETAGCSRMHHERRVHPGQKDGERKQPALDKPHPPHPADYGRPRLRGIDVIPKGWWRVGGPTPTGAAHGDQFFRRLLYDKDPDVLRRVQPRGPDSPQVHRSDSPGARRAARRAG